MGQAIDDADAVVLIISPISVLSNPVTSEVVRAFEQNKPFFPLLYGISHAEFQERAPVWRQALGASTSIVISKEGVARDTTRIAEGLVALGVEPDREAAAPVEESVEEEKAQPPKPKAVLGRVRTEVVVPRGAFVGRQREMQELDVILEDMLSGRG